MQTGGKWRGSPARFTAGAVAFLHSSRVGASAVLFSLLLWVAGFPGGAQPANPGYALSFDGLDDYLQSASPIDLANSSFTVEFWAKRARTRRPDFIVSQGRPAINHYLHIGFREGGVFTFSFWGNDLNTFKGEADTSWHHWACIYNITNHIRFIYRDGRLVASDTAVEDYQGQGPLIMGWGGPGLDIHFQGSLREVRIWKVARSEREIHRLMFQSLGSAVPGLVALYHLNHGSGTVAEDSSGHQNPAQFGDAPTWALSTMPIDSMTSSMGSGAGVTEVTNTLIDLPIRSSEYVMRAWEIEDGLPQSLVSSIAQTSDGYVWVGTFNGLARFDGIRFTVFDSANVPELKNSRIVHLYRDRADHLWILSEVGDLARYRAGQFKLYGRKDGLPPNGFSALGEDEGGQLWAGARYQEGYFRFNNGKFVSGATNSGFGPIHSLVSENDGTVWGLNSRGPATADDEIIRLTPGDPRTVEIHRGSDHLKALSIASSRDGGLWILTRLGLHLYRRGGPERVFISPEPFLSGTAILEDRRGSVWVGAGDQGLFQFDLKGTIRRYILEENPGHSEDVRCIFEDQEGNVWVGLGGRGLRLLRPRIFATYDSRDGLDGDQVKSVSEDTDGNIWLVNRSRIGQLLHGGVFSTPEVSLVLATAPQAVMRDQSGQLWVASASSGLYRYADGAVSNFLAGDGDKAFGPPAWGLFISRDQQVYLAAQTNLFSIAEGRLKAQLRPVESETFDIRAVAEDSRGRLYLGLNGSGLLCRDGTEWSRFTRAQGLAGEHIWSLYVDRTDAVWAGTMGYGLSRLQGGRFFNFNSEALPLPRVIHAIIEDDDGHLWLGSNQGIFRVERRQLNDLAAGRRSTIFSIQYTTLDGLGTSECTSGYQPSAWKARDGKLWFATAKGLSVVDPKLLPVNLLRPPVRIEEVQIDDRPAREAWWVRGGHSSPAYPPAARAARPANSISSREPRDLEAELRVPPGNRRLEIHYTGLSFAASEKVRFKYRLEGLDEEWTDVGPRRVAYFQGLNPGPYRFRVIACNNDGVWNETGASLAFTMLPQPWQTWWFRLGVAAGLAGGGGWLARRLSLMKMRRRLERLEQQHALEKERTRIAQDMHDELGASLTQITLLSDRAQKKTGQPQEARAQAGDIASLARGVVQSMDEIVWAVNPMNDTLDNLANYLCQFAEELFRGSSTRCRLDVPANLPDYPLSSEMRHHLFLTVKEALNNCLKHAGASEVWLRISVQSGRAIIVIEDDGRGFDREGLSSRHGGHGLGNMEKRIEQIHGTFAWRSLPGQGCQITLQIPLG